MEVLEKAKGHVSRTAQLGLPEFLLILPYSGEGFEVPEAWYETDITTGLSDHDIGSRRKDAGWNELVTEKENPIIQFIGYFRGVSL